MLLYRVKTTEYGIKVLEVSYKDNTEQGSIEIDAQELFKNNLDNNLFAVINEYIHSLPYFIQKEVFLTYKKIYDENYSINYNDINTVNKLENKITKVSELLNYENFKMFIRKKERLLQIPDSIEKEFVYDPNLNVIREKTYIYSEYVDLIALILFIRMLAPLYVDYFNYIRQITSFYYFKLFSLFTKSCLYSSPEIEKLREYIETNQETLADPDKNEYAIISSGLSVDDIVDNLVAEVIFNKLLYIDFFTKKCNIVSFIFQTIKYKSSFDMDAMSIRAKTTINDPSKEDISYFEDYRKNTEVPIGTIVEIQHALSNINYILNNFKDVNFDYSLYEIELAQYSKYNNMRIDKLQIYMLGWLINRAINPRALFYLDYKAVIDLLIFAKIFLYCNNHHLVSLIFSAQRTNEENVLNIVVKNSLSKSMMEKINSIYSFAIDENVNIIEKTITEISNNINNTLWIAINPLEEHMKFVNKDNYIIFPGNLNQHIVNFVEFLNIKQGEK